MKVMDQGPRNSAYGGKEGLTKDTEVISLDSVDVVSDWKAISVGRIVAAKSVSWVVVTGILKKARGEFGEVSITNMKDNTFLFAFRDSLMAKKVLNMGPWAIVGYCLNLKQWDLKLRMTDIDFSKMHVWV